MVSLSALKLWKWFAGGESISRFVKPWFIQNRNRADQLADTQALGNTAVRAGGEDRRQISPRPAEAGRGPMLTQERTDRIQKKKASLALVFATLAMLTKSARSQGQTVP